ncbi:MAG TPA: aminomethyl-transferring glycine dehydrogenase subunit GcvPB [Candidatus Cloacimonadota bacterium]|nr:aminomethyl-transferring glycine dehydrogenase subunit GcvPB [Candidatus Cloacimonadota bacterium]HOQ80012.1 aminomethyl-transferring glycine dehydrogenase subunit GcvPB [Candidatus Cloacimonadota bacterium]
MTKTIFEKSIPGRIGFILPQNDVDIKINDCIPEKYRRKNEIKLPELSELDVMRHYIELSSKNHFIEKGFYPLGSCTMKYNPKSHEAFVRSSCLMDLHPYQPEETVQGALEILYELQNDLATIAGMKNTTLQPVAGAHGEFTGLKIIRAYHLAKGNAHKNEIILPDAAHGTNPASVALAGMKVVEIKSNEKGMVDLVALKAAINENTAGFMLTNPNTLGLFEPQIEQIAAAIHGVDGLMYMDGANMNPILGIVHPGKIGFDVMHYNLHKTMSTPHGGGGPGSGAVSVVEKLEKFLPYPMVNKIDDKFTLDYSHKETSIGKIHSFYGNFAVNVRAWAYIKTLGGKGLRRAAENSVINANYIMKKLEKVYHIPHNHTYCMHEFVATNEWQKQRCFENLGDKEKCNIKTLDIAKRLLDKGYHAPTIYFPLIVHEAMMIEPTETESKQTLDEFIATMIEINDECVNTPEVVLNAPTTTPIRRIDDVKAVKELNVRFVW